MSLICQLSELNFFRHKVLGQGKGDFSVIVNDTRGVEHTL